MFEHTNTHAEPPEREATCSSCFDAVTHSHVPSAHFGGHILMHTGLQTQRVQACKNALERGSKQLYLIALRGSHLDNLPFFCFPLTIYLL